MTFKKKEELPEWQKKAIDDPKIREAIKEAYIKEKIKLARQKGIELAKEDEPKTLGEQVSNFFSNIFPQPKDSKKKKPNPLVEHMRKMGEHAISDKGMFGNQYNQKR